MVILVKLECSSTDSFYHKCLLYEYSGSAWSSYVCFRPQWDEGGIMALTTSIPAMWVKISSSWVCLAIYLWTLVAPIVLPNREF